MIKKDGNNFNPRSPHGERLEMSSIVSDKDSISIHAPRTGSDGRPPGNARPCVLISIHAPRTGSDHTPAIKESSSVKFQSTLPARGATGIIRRQEDSPVFQSTLPARGATQSTCHLFRQVLFQSTLPARGATAAVDEDAPHTVFISIHAPRTGSDSRALQRPAAPCHFNPRSPHGERLSHVALLLRLC